MSERNLRLHDVRSHGLDIAQRKAKEAYATARNMSLFLDPADRGRTSNYSTTFDIAITQQVLGASISLGERTMRGVE